MPGRGWGIALLLAALLAGCGSSGGKPRPGLTGGQAAGLQAQLEAVRATAAAGDLPGAEAALAKFRTSVAQLRRAGALSAATARTLRIGAARVLARVKTDNAPAAPQATPTTPAPAPPPPGKKKHEEHGPGKKKGHDKHGEGDE